MRIYLWFLPSLFVTVPVFAEGIVTDGSVGAVQNFVGTAVTIPQELGKTVGNNLFHSFSDFNINNGQAVTFTGSDSLQNVISRVSGNNPSVIDGTLKSDIKNADFYFINPKGITFNANAQVDVPAAFHVSTADKMDFGKNGGVFYADLTKDSQLSSEPPSAFGFLGTSHVNNGNINFNSPYPTFNANFIGFEKGAPKQILDVVAGNININGSIFYPEGTLRFMALQNESNVNLFEQETNIPNEIPSLNNSGDIFIQGSIQVAGYDNGIISMWGNNINIDSSIINAINIGNGVQKINISCKKLTINESNMTTSSAPDVIGNAGNISISSQYLNVINGAHIYSDTNGAGNGGGILLKSELINIENGATVASDTYSVGNAGKILIESNILTIDGQYSDSYTGISSDSLKDSVGNAGTINLKTSQLSVLNGATISSDTYGQGNAGIVSIESKKLTINGQHSDYYTGISSESLKDSKGNAGTVNVNSDSFSIINGGKISSNTNGQGSAGNIDISTNYLIIDNSESVYGTGIYSASLGKNSSGQTGDINIVAIDTVYVTNNSKISLENEAELVSETSSITKPSQINIKAPTILMQDSNITTESSGNTPSGSIYMGINKQLEMKSSLISTTYMDSSHFASMFHIRI